MKILRDVRAARRAVSEWAGAGERIALVPTMGNLHDGHISLVNLARRHADRVVASIFVNPTQFGPQEDYAKYPRTLAADRQRLRSAGADALFIPTVAGMYPGGGGQSTTVSVPGLSTDLCGAFRPGHFDGVASVVLRLFNILSPGTAVFGEKDYQQLTVLRQMTADLHLPIRLIGGRTIRERDGLAMSSRNQYLSPEERALAPALHATLQACRSRILAGDRSFRAIERKAGRDLYRAGFRPDYVAVRNSTDLSMPSPRSRDLRVLAAAWLGRARLIDNIAVRIR